MSKASDGYAFLYCFLRAGVRVNNFLHVELWHPDSARWPNAGGRLGVELAFGITVVCIGIALLCILQFVRDGHFLNTILAPIAGLVMLLGFPAAYFLLSGQRWMASAMSWPWLLAVPEVVCFSILFLVCLRYRFSVWAMGILMLVHYCFWCLVFIENVGFGTIYGNVPPPIILLLIPMGGITWLLYFKTSTKDLVVAPWAGYRNKWLIAGVTLAIAGMGALWLPGRGYSLVHARNPDSLSIEMQRSHCQVACPIYTVTIQANGAVDYEGEQYVRVRGSQQSFLSQDQIRTLLEAFDRADFFSLEDQAFAWSYHSAKVGVKITVDGKSKNVWSDTYYLGSKSGSQARFVEAAAVIDRVVGTDQWVKCGEIRCEP